MGVYAWPEVASEGRYVGGGDKYTRGDSRYIWGGVSIPEGRDGWVSIPTPSTDT